MGEAKPSAVSDWWKKASGVWDSLAVAAAALVTIITGFVVQPPAPLHGEDVAVKAARFVVAVLASLLFIASLRYSAKKHLRKWVVTTIVLLVLGLVLLGLYENRRQAWTVWYPNRWIVIGSQYTPNAEEYRKSQLPRVLMPVDMIRESAMNLPDIWPQAEMDLRQQRLTWLFLAAVTVLACTVVTAVQAVVLALKGVRK